MDMEHKQDGAVEHKQDGAVKTRPDVLVLVLVSVPFILMACALLALVLPFNEDMSKTRRAVHALVWKDEEVRWHWLLYVLCVLVVHCLLDGTGALCGEALHVGSLFAAAAVWTAVVACRWSGAADVRRCNPRWRTLLTYAGVVGAAMLFWSLVRAFNAGVQVRAGAVQLARCTIASVDGRAIDTSGRAYFSSTVQIRNKVTWNVTTMRAVTYNLHNTARWVPGTLCDCFVDPLHGLAWLDASDISVSWWLFFRAVASTVLFMVVVALNARHKPPQLED
jgi:hypothetical protein